MCAVTQSEEERRRERVREEHPSLVVCEALYVTDEFVTKAFGKGQNSSRGGAQKRKKHGEKREQRKGRGRGKHLWVFRKGYALVFFALRVRPKQPASITATVTIAVTVMHTVRISATPIGSLGSHHYARIWGYVT